MNGVALAEDQSFNRRVGDARYDSKVAADETGFTIQKIGDGVYAAIGGDDDPAESNAGFIVGTNGVVVVDTFEDVAPARDLLAAIRKNYEPPRPLRNQHSLSSGPRRGECGLCRRGGHRERGG